MSRFVTRIGLFILAIFWVSGVALAQLDTATLLGTVTDSSGAVVPGAKVSIQNIGTAATVELVTDSTGYFIAPVLFVGKYRVTVSLKGFKTYINDGIVLNVSDRRNLSIELSPGEVSQEITVLSEGSLVQTATAATGGVVTTRMAEALPLNGRAVEDLTLTIPGMVVNTGGGLYINGGGDGRLFQPGLKYLVDGGDSSQIDSDFAFGGYQSAARVSRLSVDAVGEFKMVTSLGSAEYGQSTGTVVNFITKSGTNELHGGFYEFFRNTVLDARDYFDPAPIPKPSFNLNQFGGTLGGPIKRDKLFFFIGYEGVRQRTGVSQVALVFTQAFRNSLMPVLQPVVAQMPLPNGPVNPDEPRVAQYRNTVSNMLTEDAWVSKIDYLPNTKDHISFRYGGETDYTATYFGVSLGQYRPIPSVHQLIKISYTRTISPTLLNEASFALNRISPDTLSAGTEAVRDFPQVTFTAGGAVTFAQGGVLGSVGPATYNLYTDNTNYQYYDTLTWIKGRHQLKFGIQAVRNQDNKAALPQNLVSFLNIDGFAANAPFYVWTFGWPRVGMRGTYWAGFAQDDFKVNSKLTINAGLRYQYDTVPTESHGRAVNFDTTTGTLTSPGTPLTTVPKTNFGPRLGFSYAPTQSQRTVIRGGFGLYYANLNPALMQFAPFDNPEVGQNHFYLFPPQAFPLPDTSTSAGLPLLFVSDQHWKGTYTEQWNLNVQQAFGQTMTLDVAYVGNRGVHLLPGNNGQNINPIIPGLGVRPYPAFGDINSNNPMLSSNYNAMQISFTRRFANNLSFGANYTWSHTFDQETLTFGPAAQNPFDYTAEYASADFDVRHNFLVYYLYEFPGVPHVPKWLGSGWQINGVTGMRSGLPINVICGCDSAGIGSVTGRPNIIPGVPLRPANYDLPSNQINLAAFATPPAGSFGNAGRNILSGPSAYNWNIGLAKVFNVREHQTLQFRFETFNLFNTPQFANPQASTAVPGFGASYSTISTGSGFGTNRQMQFALKYQF